MLRPLASFAAALMTFALPLAARAGGSTAPRTTVPERLPGPHAFDRVPVLRGLRDSHPGRSRSHDPGRGLDAPGHLRRLHREPHRLDPGANGAQGREAQPPTRRCPSRWPRPSPCWPAPRPASICTASRLPQGFAIPATNAAPPQTTWTNADITLFSDVSRTGAVPFRWNAAQPRRSREPAPVLDRARDAAVLRRGMRRLSVPPQSPGSARSEAISFSARVPEVWPESISPTNRPRMRPHRSTR